MYSRAPVSRSVTFITSPARLASRAELPYHRSSLTLLLLLWRLGQRFLLSTGHMCAPPSVTATRSPLTPRHLGGGGGESLIKDLRLGLRSLLGVWTHVCAAIRRTQKHGHHSLLGSWADGDLLDALPLERVVTLDRLGVSQGLEHLVTLDHLAKGRVLVIQRLERPLRQGCNAGVS